MENAAAQTALGSMPWFLELRTLGLSLLLAAALSGIIGLERQFKGRPAGLRTHILVCLGATLLMGASGAAGFDLGRIAAGIITGIGFLGAGTIIHFGREPIGLTTAATIWFAAALGIVIGAGYHAGGALATVVVVALITLLGRLEHWIPAERHVRLTATMGYEPEGLEQLRQRLAAGGFETVEVVRFERAANTPNTEMVLHLSTRHRRPVAALQQQVEAEPLIKRPYVIEHL